MRLRKTTWVGMAQKSSSPLAKTSLRSATPIERTWGRSLVASVGRMMSSWAMAASLGLAPPGPNRPRSLSPRASFGRSPLCSAARGARGHCRAAVPEWGTAVVAGPGRTPAQHTLTPRHIIVSARVCSSARRAAHLFLTSSKEQDSTAGSRPMLIRHPSDIAPSEITPRGVYLRRREILAGAAALGLGAMLPAARAGAAPLQAAKSPLSTTDEAQTPLKDIAGYNNFYEFGTGKDDPARNAHTLKTKPWTVKVDGLVGKPADYDLDDLIKPIQLEERIYRMRCVEGWSMVIPWVGVPLAAILNRVEPQGSAKYVAFETLVRPSEMPAQRGLFQPLPWPYVEGLRLDEAMHPLTILAVG